MFLPLLKELISIFLFVITAVGVLPCGIRKKRPRTSSLVQFIFYVWSFEISGNILRNQKSYRFRFIYSKQFELFEPHLDLYQSLYDFFVEIRNYSILLWLSLPVHSGSLNLEDWLSKTDLSGPHSFFWMFLPLLKELIIIFLFVITAAGVLPCGIRTSSLVQFIFYVWSFEISGNILRNQKNMFRFIYSKQWVIWATFRLISVIVWLLC